MTEKPGAPDRDSAKTKGGDGSGAAAGPEQPEGEQARPPLVVNAQYVKDLSFEAPATPQIFSEMQKQAPHISLHVDVRARVVEAPVYEVVLNVKAECKSGEMVAFLVELVYGGLFSVNVAAQDLKPVLLIECPRLLFPFARQIVANATLNGGFLPLMLGPVDFVALYQNEMQKEQGAEVASPAPETPPQTH